MSSGSRPFSLLRNFANRCATISCASRSPVGLPSKALAKSARAEDAENELRSIKTRASYLSTAPVATAINANDNAELTAVLAGKAPSSSAVNLGRAPRTSSVGSRKGPLCACSLRNWIEAALGKSAVSKASRSNSLMALSMNVLFNATSIAVIRLSSDHSRIASLKPAFRSSFSSIMASWYQHKSVGTNCFLRNCS